MLSRSAAQADSARRRRGSNVEFEYIIAGMAVAVVVVLLVAAFWMNDIPRHSQMPKQPNGTHARQEAGTIGRLARYCLSMNLSELGSRRHTSPRPWMP